jgi:D-glycero-D-manno-heptose 1,7-bisphosphate phosphatase
MYKAIFLDRDGVINRSEVINGVPKPPTSIETVQFLEGVRVAVKLLQFHGYEIVVITNQPDVARGNITRSEVEAINAYIGTTLGIHHFYTCFHDDIHVCNCRKPLPGLIYQAANDLGIDLKRSFVVGDRWRDIHAGQSAGCKTYFVDHNYEERRPKKPFTQVMSLLQAAENILESTNGQKRDFT